MSPPPLLSMDAVTTVTPALQSILKALPTSPYVTSIVLPGPKAKRTLDKILRRYPSVLMDRRTRSAMRRATPPMPTVSAVLMPPDEGGVTLILLANIPPDDRENWRLATDPVDPLVWRNYEVVAVADLHEEMNRYRRPQRLGGASVSRLTWRLSSDARARYREQITRTIHSARSRTGQGGPIHTRTTPGQAAQLARLGAHLARYPGAHGIRSDVWVLGLHARRLWRQQHPKAAPLSWPVLPYWCMQTLTTAPLPDPWPATPKESQ